MARAIPSVFATPVTIPLRRKLRLREGGNGAYGPPPGCCFGAAAIFRLQPDP
jgi:hypothetical protein